MKESVKTTSVICLCIALVVIAFSQADIVISSVFYSEKTGFYMRDEPFNIFIHNNMLWIDLGVLAMFIGFWFGSKINKESFFAVKKESLLFLFSSFFSLTILGKVMKELWQRPRPLDVNLFGGTEDFVYPFVIVQSSGDSFSFPSGHTICAVWLLSVALLLPKAVRKGGIVLTMAFVLSVMLSRISSGYHFMSDTIFSCLIAIPIIMALRNLCCKSENS